MHKRLLLGVALLAAGGASIVAKAEQSSTTAAYTIAFGSFAPVRPNLFIADANGEHAKPLLKNPDVDYNASFSRDGVWVVFTSERGGSADVYRAHPDGSGLERLTDNPAFDDQAAVSPDGRTLAFVSTRGGAAHIWSLDLATRALTNLTKGSTGDFRPAWSPDGEWLAFSSDRDLVRHVGLGMADATQIYVMRKDGRDLRRLTPTNASAGSPSWSPDGSRIVYYQVSNAEMPFVLFSTDRFSPAAPPNAPRPNVRLLAMDVRTGAIETLTEGTGTRLSPRWLSARGITYVSLGTNGGVERLKGSPGARGEFGNPNWSTDETMMVFHRETNHDWPPFQPWTSLDPGFRLIRTGIFPSYSPSGDRLVCNSGIAGIVHNGVLMMHADGTHRRVLFDDPARSAVAPVWSPRGDRIAFALGQFFPMLPGREGVTSQLALIDTNGQQLQLLTAAGNRAGFPSWSPDGTRLVYRAADPNGRGLRIIDLARNQVMQLTTGAGTDNFPSWSPKGDRIAFTSHRDDDYEIYSIRPDGTDLKRLTRSRGNDAHLAWSPDGEWIAFASARTGYLDELLLHPDNGQATGEIFVMRADGSDVRRLTENPWEDATPAWSPKVGRTRSSPPRK